MESHISHKILPLEQLAEKVREARQAGRTVVQSHGVFDIVHPGIIQHLSEAKKLGDLLVVTVVRDRDVRRGPGRPVFPDKMRAVNVASLEQVDFACVVDDEVPFSCVKIVKPTLFAKGQAYHERDRQIHERIFQEERDLYFDKIRICETTGFTFTSSSILQDILQIYPEETRRFLREFGTRHGFSEIAERLHGLNEMKILLFGDAIIDEYCYCQSLGKSAKSNLVVSKFLTAETFAGGTLAVANHLAGLCRDVELVTTLGREDSREEFIRVNLRPNVRPTFFIRDDGPTVIKRRYLHQYSNQKLFEVNYLNDIPLNGAVGEAVLSHLHARLPQCDLLLISDFGHGLVTDRCIRLLTEHAPRWAVNAQINAANAGYNLITKYHRPLFVCLDESEARVATQERFSPVEEVVGRLSRMLETPNLIVTLGKAGAIARDASGRLIRTPIFSSKVVDTVGAGDAFFAFAAPCVAAGMPLDLVSFVGNAVGALAVQIMGNKKPVERHELLEFVRALLPQEKGNRR